MLIQLLIALGVGVALYGLAVFLLAKFTGTAQEIIVEGYGRRVLHFNSLACVLLSPGGVNNAFSPNAEDIYIRHDYIQQMHLAHEFCHGEQAKEYGPLYLPWVGKCYVTQGYAKSDPEVLADQYMEQHYSRFPSIVRLDA